MSRWKYLLHNNVWQYGLCRIDPLVFDSVFAASTPTYWGRRHTGAADAEMNYTHAVTQTLTLTLTKETLLFRDY